MTTFTKPENELKRAEDMKLEDYAKAEDISTITCNCVHVVGTKRKAIATSPEVAKKKPRKMQIDEDHSIKELKTLGQTQNAMQELYKIVKKLLKIIQKSCVELGTKEKSESRPKLGEIEEKQRQRQRQQEIEQRATRRLRKEAILRVNPTCDKRPSSFGSSSRFSRNWR